MERYIQLIENELPLPVARAASPLFAAPGDPAAAQTALSEAARFVALVLLAERFSEHRTADRSELQRCLKVVRAAPSLEGWLTLWRLCAAAQARPAISILGPIRELAIDSSRSGLFLPTGATELFRELSTLASLRLIHVLHSTAGVSARKMNVLLLHGQKLSAPPTTLESEAVLDAGRVYLLDLKERITLDLDPLVQVRADADGQPRVLGLLQAHRRLLLCDHSGATLEDHDGFLRFELLARGREAPPRQQRKLLFMPGESDDNTGLLPPGRVVDDRFRIVRHLGSGGMAQVYEAIDTAKGETCALKVLPFRYLSDRTMVLRFKEEVAAASTLDHPRVARVLRSGQDGGDHYLVMDLATGWPLAEGGVAVDLSQVPKPVYVPDALRILAAIADGLGYLHSRDTIHRDLKPGNVLLDAGGALRLCDLGIARTKAAVTLTMTGMILGTPEYMAPEQVEQSRVDARADIYSFGCLAYELLIGEPPFKGQSPLAVMYMHAHEAVPELHRLDPEIPEGLSLLIARCLAKDPAGRPQTSRELFETLMGLGADLYSIRPLARRRGSTGLEQRERQRGGRTGDTEERPARSRGRLLPVIILACIGLLTLAAAGTTATLLLWPQPAPVAEAPQPALAAPAPQHALAPVADDSTGGSPLPGSPEQLAFVRVSRRFQAQDYPGCVQQAAREEARHEMMLSTAALCAYRGRDRAALERTCTELTQRSPGSVYETNCLGFLRHMDAGF